MSDNGAVTSWQELNIVSKCDLIGLQDMLKNIESDYFRQSLLPSA